MNKPSKDWCKGFCHTCGTGCAQYCEQIHELHLQVAQLEAEKETWGNEFNASMIMTDQLAAQSERVSELEAEVEDKDRVVTITSPAIMTNLSMRCCPERSSMWCLLFHRWEPWSEAIPYGHSGLQRRRCESCGLIQTRSIDLWPIGESWAERAKGPKADSNEVLNESKD